ncbi:MAG TPA: hypothetical protein VFM90_02115, partial [Cyclobacteriaceae bacterium]|nr:hypothetical protein [Cyclobacteriaceae bacterium]
QAAIRSGALADAKKEETDPTANGAEAGKQTDTPQIMEPAKPKTDPDKPPATKPATTEPPKKPETQPAAPEGTKRKGKKGDG